MKDQHLQKLRNEIDALNKEIVAVLSKRAQIAQQIGATKKPAEIYRPAREAEVLTQVRAQNDGPLSDEAITGIFTEIIGACRNLERRLRVAYLGPEGTYSEEAAVRFAGSSSEFVPCPTIDDAVQAVQSGQADIVVVPVENSTEGTVHRTLDILLETNLKVNGEVLLPIHHQLLSKQTELAQVQEVLAHPQALAQCRQWLAKHMPHAALVPVSSNGEAAKRAAKDHAKAAIAGTHAAHIYALPVLGANIEDAAGNTTRFLVLGSQELPSTGHDKTSLVCTVPNRVGSLYGLLGIFNRHAINLIKLESRPLQGSVWEYQFYIDCDGHAKDVALAAALTEARHYVVQYKLLGSYPKSAGGGT